MIYMFKAGDIVTGKPGLNTEFATFKICGFSNNKRRADFTCVSTENILMFKVGYMITGQVDDFVLVNKHSTEFYHGSTTKKNSLNFIVSLVKS